MSTEHQRYSIENQQATIAEYAASHEMRVVETYADPGRSGLSLRRRPGLQRLLNDVISGQDRFSVVLILDISRWGRFQDTDESAHYEFLLRRAGLKVIYCAEPFENDGSGYASIVKALKRTMAGEYSREMSVRIIRARRRYAAQGFWQGSKLALGLRRVLVGPDGTIKVELQEGQRKWLQGDHVKLVPGPPEEVATVRRVFDLFVHDCRSLNAIAAQLAAENVRRPYGGVWNGAAVRRMLVNEAYIGNLVTERFKGELGGYWNPQPREYWRRVESAFPAIVDQTIFHQAGAILEKKGRRLSDEILLDALRDLWRRKGRLSHALVAEDRLTPGVTVYFRRFGGLTEAYRRIGYDPERSCAHLPMHKRLKHWRTRFTAQLASGFTDAGATVQAPRKSRLRINDEFTLAISVLTRSCVRHLAGYWFLSTEARSEVDGWAVLRVAPGESEILDYLLVPSRLTTGRRVYLRQPLQPPFNAMASHSLEGLLRITSGAMLDAFGRR